MSEPDENGWAAEIKARAASILCEAGALCGWPAPNCNAREGAEALYQAGLLSARSAPEAGKAAEAQLRAAWEAGRNAWCPAGILKDTERTERDWQRAMSALASSPAPTGAEPVEEKR